MKKPARKSRKPAPRGRGAFRILEFTNPSGVVVYRVIGWRGGVRIRQNFPSHGEALARLQQLEIEATNLADAARPIVTRLTAAQVAEAETAFAELCGCPLVPAVRFYLDNYREPVTKITVADAVAKFMAERRSANLRPHSLVNLRAKTLELVARHGRQFVSGITADTLRPLIFKPSRGPLTRNNCRRVLHGFFQWARQQGFCAENPVAKIPIIKTERHEPCILTPEQTAKLLAAASAYKDGLLVPYVALAVFAGLRPRELARITWDRIDLPQRTITLDASLAKMRARRLVTISENLAAWLTPFTLTRPAIVPPNWCKDFNAVKETVGWGTPTDEHPDLRPWQQDTLRHSAVSYHLARCQHEGETAAWAGNSPNVIQAHYRALVKPAEAAKFWKITPETVKGEIVQFPAQAAA